MHVWEAGQGRALDWWLATELLQLAAEHDAFLHGHNSSSSSSQRGNSKLSLTPHHTKMFTCCVTGSCTIAEASQLIARTLAQLHVQCTTHTSAAGPSQSSGVSLLGWAWLLYSQGDPPQQPQACKLPAHA
jgi:hypothetical protein